jgi:hypothetical protein
MKNLPKWRTSRIETVLADLFLNRPPNMKFFGACFVGKEDGSRPSIKGMDEFLFKAA